MAAGAEHREKCVSESLVLAWVWGIASYQHPFMNDLVVINAVLSKEPSRLHETPENGILIAVPDVALEMDPRALLVPSPLRVIGSIFADQQPALLLLLACQLTLRYRLEPIATGEPDQSAIDILEITNMLKMRRKCCARRLPHACTST